MVQGVHPGRPGQGMGIPTLAGPSAQSLPPLVGLPEPEKLPTGDDVVDLPEEVLCESERSMRAAAGRKIWVWMAIVGFVSWGALAMVFLGSLTPLFLFLPIFAIADPSFVASLLNGLGASPGVHRFWVGALRRARRSGGGGAWSAVGCATTPPRVPHGEGVSKGDRLVVCEVDPVA